MEKIDVYYKRVISSSTEVVPVGVPVFHKYIIYTDSSGTQWYARGGPASGTPGATVTGPSPLGDIVTEHGEYTANTRDWDQEGDDPHEIITSGEDLSDKWERIRQSMDDIASEHHPYYPGADNSNTTVDKALDRSGLPQPQKDGWDDNWAPGSGREFGTPLDWSMGDPFTGMPWPGVDPDTNTNYRNALPTPVRRDPLAIDLDGDGIETVGITATPILFDHNADGIRTGTGWVKADDAWLVLDRDGNGLIDSGRELFGVDTLLSGTPGVDAVYASTGFAALAALNSNGDGVFNASDAAFTQVQLWQDLNQDGISQGTELFTLAQKNIHTSPHRINI